jgi:hypothetical protein
MKNYLKIAIVFAFASIWFAGCKKDENQNFFLGGTNPRLAASKTNVVLTPQTENDQAIAFSWTNPNYQFSTGLSSHDVQYALELDINQQFNSPQKYVATIARDLARSFTVGEFNSILANGMLLPLDVNVTIYARVVSSLRFEGAVNAELPSNIITIATRPYALPPLVAVPVDGTLWATGNAFASDWSNPLPAPFDVTQQFTKVAGSNTLYEAVVTFIGGGGYKLIQRQGVWSTQYHRVDGDAFAGNFRMADAEPGFIGPPAAGRYKITVNFQSGRFTVVPQ